MRRQDEKIIYCINQVFRPSMNIRIEDYGDCTRCVRDEKNKECKRYNSVTVYIIEVNPHKYKENKQSKL